MGMAMAGGLMQASGETPEQKTCDSVPSEAVTVSEGQASCEQSSEKPAHAGSHSHRSPSMHVPWPEHVKVKSLAPVGVL